MLEGMRDGLGRRRYRRVLVELHPWMHADAAAELAAMYAVMAGAGYHGWRVDEGAARARRALYGALPKPVLLPLPSAPPATWTHLLWTRPGAEPA